MRRVARRHATDDPEEGDWRSRVLNLPLSLALGCVVSFRTLLNAQPDMLAPQDEQALPLLVDVPCTVNRVVVHIASGILTVTHHVSVRCATDLRLMLGCDVLLQWTDVQGEVDNPGSNVPENDDDPLPAEL